MASKSSTTTQAVQPKAKKSTPIQHMIASQVAAGIATVSFYPFDVVRMRFMSQDGTKERLHNNRYYDSTFKALRCIRKEEGIRTLFRGSHVSVMGVVVSWGVYMWIFRWLQDIFHDVKLPVLGKDTFSVTAFWSIVASIAAAFMGNPIWMAKTRMQLEAVKPGGGEIHYSTFVRSIRHTVKTTGLRSLWRGFSAQVLLSVPNSLMLPLYDFFKKTRMQAVGSDKLALHEVCACSLMAKTLIAWGSHPIIVIKTRLMDEKSRVGTVQYRNLGSAFVTTVKREGLKGLFRGLMPGLCQSIPRNLMHFVLYEYALASNFLDTKAMTTVEE